MSELVNKDSPWWQKIPLYLQIAIALILAVFLSVAWGASLPQQLIVVFTSIFASVGAAGIPEAGLVTMTLVFTAVGLPTQYNYSGLVLGSLSHRINVMGDMTVSCLLDGKQPQLEK